jgi:hypothetical protein
LPRDWIERDGCAVCRNNNENDEYDGRWYGMVLITSFPEVVQRVIEYEAGSNDEDGNDDHDDHEEIDLTRSRT